MTDQLTITKAGKDDIELISRLAKEIWVTYYPPIISDEQIEYMIEMMYSVKSLREQLKEGHTFYLAYALNEPVGYLSYSEKGNNNYYLHKLYLKTTEHHKGLGSELLNFLVTLLPSQSRLRLTVNRKNYKAINFYFKNGFYIEEVMDFDIGKGFFMKDFVMLKKI